MIYQNTQTGEYYLVYPDGQITDVNGNEISATGGIEYLNSVLKSQMQAQTTLFGRD